MLYRIPMVALQLVALLPLIAQVAPAGELPTPYELWEQGGKERITALNVLRRDFQQRREGKGQVELTEREREFLGTLAKDKELPLDLRGMLADCFREIGRPTEECMIFCREIASAADAGPTELKTVLKLLDDLKINNDDAMNLVGRFLSVKDCARNASRYLVEHHADNPKVGALFVSAAGLEDDTLAALAWEYLSDVNISQDDARNMVALFEKRVSASVGHDDLEQRQLRFAGGMSNLIGAHPSAFGGVVNEEMSGRLLSAGSKASERYLRQTIFFLLLAGADDIPMDILDLANQDTREHPRSTLILASTGFFQTQGSDKAFLEKLMALAKSSANCEAKTGLFSLYWRSKGSVSAALLDRPDWLRVLSDPYRKALELPDEGYDARKMWGRSADRPDLKRIAVDDIPRYDKAGDVAWVVDQALGEPPLERNLLCRLWSIRNRLKDAGLSQTCREWLVERTKKSNSYDAILAAGVLAYAYEEVEASRQVIGKYGEQEMLSGRWPIMLDILLHVDPKNDMIDRHRENMAKWKAPSNHGVRWLMWLLDLRRGQEVGQPPVDDLLLALSTGDEWVPALVECGDKAVPYLKDLRTPRVFVAVSGPSFSSVMRYLGALDRLEMLRFKREE